MWFGVLTLFPEMFQCLELGITGRALREKRIALNLWNPRDYTQDKHHTVDDRPYGGGPGMIMQAPPLQQALDVAKAHAPSKPIVIHLSPQGKVLDQAEVKSFATKKNSLLMIAGRYEGIDQRFIDRNVDEEWSIGNYILSGGELAAMVMIDAITRHLPGALGHEESADSDSLAQGLLKYPQYTRPEKFADLAVPEILLSGNHQAIERWRLQQSLGTTWQKRPDLLSARTLNEEEQKLLKEFIALHKP